MHCSDIVFELAEGRSKYGRTRDETRYTIQIEMYSFKILINFCHHHNCETIFKQINRATGRYKNLLLSRWPLSINKKIWIFFTCKEFKQIIMLNKKWISINCSPLIVSNKNKANANSICVTSLCSSIVWHIHTHKNGRRWSWC